MMPQMHPIPALFMMVLDIASFLLLVWIIVSWLVSFRVLNTSNRFVYAVYDTMNKLFEPMLRPIRRFMPDLGTIDLSPLVLFFAIRFTQYCIDYYF